MSAYIQEVSEPCWYVKEENSGRGNSNAKAESQEIAWKWLELSQGKEVVKMKSEPCRKSITVWDVTGREGDPREAVEQSDTMWLFFTGKKKNWSRLFIQIPNLPLNYAKVAHHFFEAQFPPLDNNNSYQTEKN